METKNIPLYQIDPKKLLMALIISALAMFLSSVQAAEAGSFIIRYVPVKPSTEHFYKLRMKYKDNLAIAVEGNKKARGANIEVNIADNSDAQLFKFRSVGKDYYEIVSKLNDYLVMEVKGGKPEVGTNIQLGYRKNSKSQYFKILRDNFGNIFIEPAIKAKMVLNVGDNQIQAGNNVQLSKRNRSKRQMFKLTKIENKPNGTSIKKVIGGYQQYVLIPKGNAQFFVQIDETPAWIKNVKLSKSKKSGFRFFHLGKGIYKITSGNFVLGVNNWRKLKYPNVIAEPWRNINSQKFRVNIFRTNGKEYIEIESLAYSGQVVNLYGGTFKDGNNIWLSPRNNGNAQRFQLSEINSGNLDAGNKDRPSY